jgi:hypothetical protein
LSSFIPATQPPVSDPNLAKCNVNSLEYIITRSSQINARRLPPAEQELLTFPEDLSSPPGF